MVTLFLLINYGIMLKKVTLDSIEVIGAVDDAGSSVELYFYLRPDNGSVNTRSKRPEGEPITLSKKIGSIAKVNITVDVENVISVTLMEADSSSADDNYGENAICAHSYSGFVVYDGKFRLNYTTERSA